MANFRPVAKRKSTVLRMEMKTHARAALADRAALHEMFENHGLSALK